MTKILHTSCLPIHLSRNLESFITLFTELTKLTKLPCFWSWQLSSYDVIKNYLNYWKQCTLL